MMLNKQYKILNYKITNYLVKYSFNINKNTRNFLSKSKTNDLGIMILEIKDWDKTMKVLRNLFHLSLFDSFSVQIEINQNYTRELLIIEMLGMGLNELEFRYNNFFSKIDEISDIKFEFFRNEELEKIFLSIVSENNTQVKSDLRNLQIIKGKEGYHYSDSRNSDPNPYFYLIEFETENLFQNSNNFSNLIEILYSMNVKGNLVFYSSNSSDFTLNTCYLFGKTSSIKILENELQQNLIFYNLKPANSFHPLYLGKILLRNPIKHKNLKRFRTPPIFNASAFSNDLLDLSSKDTEKKEFNGVRHRNSIRSNSLSIPNSSLKDKLNSRLSDNEEKTHISISHKKGKLNTGNNKKESNFQLENFIRKIDKSSSKKSDNKYYLFGSKCCLNIIEKINDENINSAISDFSKNFSYYIFHFIKSRDFNLFKSKLKLSNDISHKIIFSRGINELIQKLGKIKLKVSNNDVKIQN